MLYRPRFKCWDGVRRTFPGIEDINAAKRELIRLKELDRQHVDFNKILAPIVENERLFTWIDAFLEITKQKKSAEADRIRARYLKEFLPTIRASMKSRTRACFSTA